MHSAVELLIRCGFPEAAPDTDAERRVATVAATLNGWSSALAAGVAGDANAAVRVLRSRLDVDPRASGVFAGARACADDREFVEALLETIRRFAHLAHIDAASKAAVAGWVSFKEPEKRDFEALVPHDVEAREGFDGLEGTRGKAPTTRWVRANRQAPRPARTSCTRSTTASIATSATRTRARRACATARTARIKKNPLGVPLTGCPLDEKISEMHVVKRAGRHRRRARAGRASTTRCARAPATASATTA